MKRILKYWLDGWIVIIKVIYFYIVLQIIASVFMFFVPLLFWLGTRFKSETTGSLIMLLALILCLIILPFPFLIAANITNVFKNERQFPLEPSPENEEKGRILMKELKARNKRINPNPQRNKNNPQPNNR